jgi:uncharacterized membrane protein
MTPAMLLHISAASFGLLSGAAALSVRKGERLHRRFGDVFTVSMLTMAAMATYLAVVMPGQSANIFGGVFTLYLVASGWVTVRRKAGTVGRFEVGAVLVPFVAAIVMLFLGLRAAANPTGQPMSAPPLPAYFIFASVAALAGALDVKVIAQGGVSGVDRITRHLWRMCVALFVATGSFFLGKQKDMPAFMHGSPVLIVLAVAPLVLMLFWLFRVRVTAGPRPQAMASQGG